MKLTPIVYHILKTNEKARENDQVLACFVYDTLGADVTKSFLSVMTNLSLPTIESISRCRRKLQNKFEDLRPSEEIRRIRQEEKAKYIAYAKGEIII